MLNRNRQNRRPLSLEQLESRFALAGDVFIDVVNGNLKITGDAAANDLFIAQQSPGNFIVFANDVVTPERFHLNGVDLGDAVFQVDVNGVTGNISFDMKGGDDNVQLDGTGIADALAKNLVFKGGTGSDGFQLSDGLISGKVTIDTGKGDLNADADGVQFQNVNVAKAVSISTGNGVDIVSVNQSTFAANVSIKTGAGSDTVELDGNVQFAKKLTINTGKATGGIDTVRFQNGVQVLGNTSVTTGDGNDNLQMGAATLKKVTVKTGAGVDNVLIGNGGASVVDQAIISLGKGDDFVNVGGGTFTMNGPKKTKVVGGAGFDTVNGGANIVNNNLISASGIEALNP